MVKKDYKAINADVQGNVNKGVIHTSVERGRNYSRAQRTASAEEQAERREKMKTQGRKGCKATRVNMILTPNNHTFVKIMSNVMGMSMAEFTNYVLSRFQSEHPEIYNKAVPFMEFGAELKRG